jgi:hypothetical protein
LTLNVLGDSQFVLMAVMFALHLLLMQHAASNAAWLHKQSIK